MGLEERDDVPAHVLGRRFVRGAPRERAENQDDVAGATRGRS